MLTIAYLLFLGVMMVNLIATAVFVTIMDTDPWMRLQIPWLTPELYLFILLVFVNCYWLMHFSFTNLRLLNMAENRKLLGFAFPHRRLAKYLMIIGFCHPVNIIYNFTWMVFLLIQVKTVYHVPVAIMAVMLNYVLIYSVKHRFIKVIERRFIAVVIGFLFLIFGLFQAISFFSSNSARLFSRFIPEIETINGFLSWTPGGLLVQTVYGSYGWIEALVFLVFGSTLIGLILVDHFNKTCQGLLNPAMSKEQEKTGPLWTILRKVLGNNAGKYYYYVMIHPYNKLQSLTLTLVPIVYVPILLQVKYELAQTVLIPTILAGIPVALLAMGMANMYGYENRELLLHLQFPIKLEKQLKERFLGVITFPLLVFYVITVFEALFIPGIGTPIQIFVANTFFFLIFMLLFLWSSYYQYQKATYSSFSYKHPIIPQKVTLLMSFSIFSFGYLVFIPIEGLEWYRLTIMGVVIIVTGIYIWRHLEVLVSLFKKRVLIRLWNDL